MVYSWYFKLYIQDFMLYCMHSLSVADGISKNCVKSGDLFMGSQSVVYGIPRQVTCSRCLWQTGSQKHFLLGQVIYVWDPMLSHMSLLIIANKVIQTARGVRTFTTANLHGDPAED